MSDSERKNKERDLANLNSTFQRQSREFREDLNQRRNEELGKIQERARKAIAEIGKAEKYDIIIEQAAVYVDPKTDITDRVMKALGTK
jgi:Outer membrane protein